MLPVVHGAEKTFKGRVTFLYFDISDPKTERVRQILPFKSTPQFFVLDAKGTILGERRGVIPGADFEAWIESMLR